MSENVRVVERLGEVLSGEDWVVRMNDEALLREGSEALAQATAPEFEFALVGPDPSFRGEFRGVDGFIEGLEDWLTAFDSFRLETGELLDNGDRIVALGRLTATPKGTAQGMGQDAAAVFMFEDGKLRRLEFHLDPETAKRAAGLEP